MNVESHVCSSKFMCIVCLNSGDAQSEALAETSVAVEGTMLPKKRSRRSGMSCTDCELMDWSIQESLFYYCRSFQEAQQETKKGFQ